VLSLLLYGCSIGHRPVWQLDPQGQGSNLAAPDCLPPRTPYYIYPDGITPFYIECLREHLN
jgi:hypothetical protein